jgi:SHAQKYF class myb-like DNA-binding protein
MAQGGDISAALNSTPVTPSAADEAVFKRLQTSLAHMADRDNTGRWGNGEHELFLHCVRVFGKDWNKCADILRTRTVIQIRTHAQKHFHKVAKENGAGNGGGKAGGKAGGGGKVGGNKAGAPAANQYLGVKVVNSGRWAARIQHDGKDYHIGTFATEMEAADAYVEDSCHSV